MYMLQCIHYYYYYYYFFIFFLPSMTGLEDALTEKRRQEYWM